MANSSDLVLNVNNDTSVKMTNVTSPETASRTQRGEHVPSSGIADLLGNPAPCFVDGVEFDNLDSALGDAQYVAFCFSASYCKYCREFVPLLETALPLLKKEKKCRVVLIGGDKTEEAFDQYREHHKDFVSMTFSATEPAKLRLREEWDIKTIPHVTLLDRSSGAVVNANIRHDLVEDPNCAKFPWSMSPEMGLGKSQEELLMHFGDGGQIQNADTIVPLRSGGGRPGGFRDRISKDLLFELGHRINGRLYMDENTVRARAGLLNLTSWLALLNILLWKESTLLYVLYPVVCFDMMVASAFGVVPLSPYGLLGAFLASTFGPAQPLWKPAEPKRFAWIVGFFLVNMCFLGWFYEIRPVLLLAVSMCNAATWAESVLGFCVGCWMWNTIIAPRLGKAACEECKL